MSNKPRLSIYIGCYKNSETPFCETVEWSGQPLNFPKPSQHLPKMYLFVSVTKSTPNALYTIAISIDQIICLYSCGLYMQYACLIVVYIVLASTIYTLYEYTHACIESNITHVIICPCYIISRGLLFNLVRTYNEPTLLGKDYEIIFACIISTSYIPSL